MSNANNNKPSKFRLSWHRGRRWRVISNRERAIELFHLHAKSQKDGVTLIEFVPGVGLFPLLQN